MKKVLLLTAALVMCASTMFAQLSTRENDATVEKIGARPVAGNMALNFAMDVGNLLSSDSTDGKAGLKIGNTLAKGDLLTFKYYLQDDLAMRVGFRLFRDNMKSSGELQDSSMFFPIDTSTSSLWLKEATYKNSKREYVLVPGIEKHFNGANIFDVYAGADLYLGFGKDKSDSTVVFHNAPGFPGATTESSTIMTTNTTIVGLGGVVGFNIFVAQLPVSIGIEYGWNAKWTLGGKTKVEKEDVITGGPNAGTYSTEYFESGNNAFGNPDVDPNGNQNQYESLKKKQFYMDTNQNIRLTLNIYFGK